MLGKDRRIARRHLMSGPTWADPCHELEGRLRPDVEAGRTVNLLFVRKEPDHGKKARPKRREAQLLEQLTQEVGTCVPVG